jgi:hypothetical protein
MKEESVCFGDDCDEGGRREVMVLISPAKQPQGTEC